jgi:hypothetical protein
MSTRIKNSFNSQNSFYQTQHEEQMKHRKHINQALDKHYIQDKYHNRHFQPK